jgi:hypothetical protein
MFPLGCFAYTPITLVFIQYSARRVQQNKKSIPFSFSPLKVFFMCE